MLVALTTTGLLVLGGEEKQGPLAAVASYAVGNARQAGARGCWRPCSWSWSAATLLGVLGESLLTRENLVAAMITGAQARCRRTCR